MLCLTHCVKIIIPNILEMQLSMHIDNNTLLDHFNYNKL